MLDVTGLDTAVNLLDPADQLHPLNRGKVAWWLALPGLMGGPRWRDLIGTNDGVLTNGPAWKPTTRTGGWGQLDFSASHVAVADAPALRVAAGDLTIGAWVYPITLPSGGYRTLLEKSAGTTRELGIFFERTDSLYFALGGIAGISATLAPAFTTGEWQRFLLARAGSAVTIYRNGVACGSATMASTTTGTDPLRIGNTTSTGAAWDGSLDDVSVWSRGLSAAEAWADFDLSRRGYPSC